MDRNQYDALIKRIVEAEFPELVAAFGDTAWLWIKAQVWQESDFDPRAVSKCGAKGLLQLMPATGKEWGLKVPFDPEQNLTAGISFLCYLYNRFQEIPVFADRLRCAFGAYNGGPGYVNKALEIARGSTGLPAKYSAWKAAGSLPGVWQLWAYASAFLAHPKCRCNGRAPDYIQIVYYVEEIGRKYGTLLRKWASLGGRKAELGNM